VKKVSQVETLFRK